MAATGMDLSSWLRTHPPLGMDQVVLFATGLADQLAAVHAAGLVHGALAPAAVLAEPAGGRIRPVLAGQPRRPQLPGPTPPDDMYAFGMLLRTLLDAAGAQGHGAGGDAGAVRRPPPALDSLVGWCMAGNPADRPTAAAVAGQLRSIGRDLLLGFAAGPAEPAAATPGYVPVTADPGPPPPPGGRRSRRTLVLVATAVALVLAAGGTVAALTRHPAHRSVRVPAGTGGSGGSGAGTATPRISTSPVPPRSSPLGSPYLMSGSEVSLNAASQHGCRAWMNGSDPGPYAQAVVESTGDDCEMSLWRSRNGGKTFAILSGTHRIHAGTDSTNYYWAGDAYLAHVCLTDHSTGQSACGKAFGGPSPPAGH